mgnify:CR=1 FL=1
MSSPATLEPLAPTTDHISYKRSERKLKDRATKLSKQLNKTKSDTYKYALNTLYLRINNDSDYSIEKEIVFL